MVTKTIDDLRTEISNEILSRLPNLDLTEGTPERDIFVEAPIAGELSTIWDKIIYTAKLHAPLAYYSDLNTEDIQAYLSNYNIVPFPATHSTGTVTFYLKNAPARDITIASGSLVQTDSTSPIVFSVSADYIMYASLASYYYNTVTNRYEIKCNVQAVNAGPQYRAGSNTVTSMSTSIIGIDGVTNTNAISGGQAAETVESALRRVIDKFQGRNISSTKGIRSYVQKYSSTVNLIGANDPEMVRDEGNGGAIDIYIIGETQTNGTDNISILEDGLNNPLTVNYSKDTIYMLNQPVLVVLSVIRVRNSVTTILPPTHYTFIEDTGILKRSSRSYDHIILSSTGLAPYNQITLENASNVSNALGFFGSYLGHGFSLKKSEIVDLTEGTDFQWLKRMDASIYQDVTDGFGTVAGGIIDTGVSGALSTGKYIRIVEGTKNIVNATGLALKVYAKNLSIDNTPPPKDRIFIDPILGKFILPQPIYWSKCETVANLTTGDIGSATLLSTDLPILTPVVGKFTNSIRIETPSVSVPLVRYTVGGFANTQGLVYDGEYIWVTDFTASKIFKINPTTKITIASVTTGAANLDVCFDGTYLWVTNWDGNSVSVLNPATNVVVTTIPVSTHPRGICYGNGYIWVINYNSHNVTVISATTRTFETVVVVGNYPKYCVFDGLNVWVTNSGDDSVTIINSLSKTSTGLVHVGNEPYNLCYDPTDNGYIWVTNNSANTVTVIDATTKLFVTLIPTSINPQSICYNNGFIWIGTDSSPGGVTVIDTATKAFYEFIPFTSQINGICSDGSNVWVSTNSDVVEIIPTLEIQRSGFTLTEFGLVDDGPFTLSFWLAPTYSDTLYDVSGPIWDSSVKIYFNLNSYVELFWTSTTSGSEGKFVVYNEGSFMSSTGIIDLITLANARVYNHCYVTISNITNEINWYINSTNNYSATGPFDIQSDEVKLVLTTASNNNITSSSQLFLDNLKVWNEIPTTSATWEYNNTADTGLHYIYGATNGFRPKLSTDPSGVGYNYVNPIDPLHYFEVGDSIQINYIYNSIYKTIETDLNSTPNHYINRDYLARGMYPVTIDVYCRFKQIAGQDFNTVANSVQLSIADFLNSILNKGNVERADIAGIMKANASVDNIDLAYHTPPLPTDFYLINTGGGTLTTAGDVIIRNNEYPVAGTITLIPWTS